VFQESPEQTVTAIPPAGDIPHAGGVPNPDERVSPAEPRSGDPRATTDEFRAAMSRFTSGVTLVTTHDPEDGVRGEDVGMTATAFLSVSLEPPLVLVSVRVDSRMDDLLERQPYWAVSVLSESQRHVAGRFAMRGRISDRLLFDDIPYIRGAASGAPLIGGALSVLECRTTQRIPAGDHTLVIAEVLTARTPSADGRPLTYFRGRYHQLG
jgi:flavin reductase (DIM6/NTAB) family NADH-FMN oxidoreductase RutF